MSIPDLPDIPTFLIVSGVAAASLVALFIYARSEFRAFRTAMSHLYEGDPLSVVDSDIGFGSNPRGLSRFFLRDSSRFVSVSANPQRLRVVPEKRHDVVETADILAIGCSFTFGFGVEAEQAYPAVVQRLSGHEVANAAAAGYSTLGALLTLQRLMPLRPKLVIYGYIDVHLRRNLSPSAPSNGGICRSQAYVAMTKRGPEIRPPQVNGWGQRLFASLLIKRDAGGVLIEGGKGLALLAGRLYSSLTAPVLADDPESQAVALAYLLQRMKDATDAMGSRLVVVRIPQGLPFVGRPREFSPAPDALLKAVPAGVELWDMSGALARTFADQSLRLSPDDGHPNVLAHQIIGREVARRLGGLPHELRGA